MGLLALVIAVLAVLLNVSSSRSVEPDAVSNAPQDAGATDPGVEELSTRGAPGEGDGSEGTRTAVATGTLELAGEGLDAPMKGVSGRVLDADAPPVDVELLGEQHRQRGEDTLPHLRGAHLQGGRAVPRDPDPGAHRELYA